MVSWRASAACHGMDVSVFYVPIGERDTPAPEQWRAACGSCVVRNECLTDSLQEREYVQGAVRGGMLPREQRQLARAAVGMKGT